MTNDSGRPIDAMLPLSVCMIVRDEEANLAEAIESVRSVACEVIVVDTGSRDRTVEIATTLGARLLHFRWCDDFSAARNVAVAAASSDWILSLDADERLEPQSVPMLAAAMAVPAKAQVVHIDLIGGTDPQSRMGHNTALRLFRRDERVRYRGRVHEDLSESLLEAGSTDWPDSGVRLRHVGYIDASERQRKRERNVALLERSHAERPGDLFVAFKLAVSLPPVREGERRALLAKTIDAACALTREELQGLPFMPRLLAAAIASLVDQGRLHEAAALCSTLQPTLGSSTYFTSGRAFARAGIIDLGASLLERYLGLRDEDLPAAVLPDPDANATEGCRWLAWLARLEGRPAIARQWLARALSTARPDQIVPVECDAMRLRLDAGDIAGVAGGLDRLAAMASGSQGALSELMLLSAELSVAAGDRSGAKPLACAALVPGDDRAAALLAELEMADGEVDDARLHQHLTAVVGRRFDTLAVRVRLALRLGTGFEAEIPLATHRLLEAA